jgi:CHAT domain-containing protein
VLEVYARTLPDDHADIQLARLALAATIKELGDVAGARVLQERVLAIQSRKLSDDHPALQKARGSLARTLATLREFAAARALQEKVLAVYSASRAEDHPDVQAARENLSNTLLGMGEIALARELQDQVLAARTKSLPDDALTLQWARGNLAGTLRLQGDLAGSRALYEKVHEVFSRSLPDDHPDRQRSRQSLAVALALESGFAQRASAGAQASGRDRCLDLIGALARAQVHAARAAILGSPGREAEERCSSMAWVLDVCASFAQGYGVFEPLHTLDAPAFVLEETTRGAALVSAELARRAASTPRYRELRKALQVASSELAALAQGGTSSEEFDRARVKREGAERELAALARELTGGQRCALDLDLESLAGRLGAQDAALGFRRYARRQVELRAGQNPASQPEAHDTYVDNLCAFVLRRAQAGAAASASPVLTLVDLGPLAAIESAARGWRAAIGAGQERGKPVGAAEVDRVSREGGELRRLVLDPLLPAIGAAQHLRVALDDVLHLVPLEALPLGDGQGLAGDRWQIETRATLTELLSDMPEPQGTLLLALGGASFNLTPVALAAEDVAPLDAQPPAGVAQVLRGGAWARGFEPLTHTGDEARGIGALYAEIFEGKLEACVLEKRKASRAALEELAPRARFVHIATHGWFAPESIRSWSDAEPLDKLSGLGARTAGEAQVKGMSPMLLCGLALAGANLPEGATGRLPGLLTAEELSTLDLAGCELAVLSACDTNVGERRAGQGVHSLQMALQMAGARSVITSLWKVPDEATKELMLDFYRRLWVEKQPKWKALWEAKKKLREAKDETGQPKYSMRDWAAWVLTGAPD